MKWFVRMSAFESLHTRYQLAIKDRDDNWACLCSQGEIISEQRNEITKLKRILNGFIEGGILMICPVCKEPMIRKSGCWVCVSETCEQQGESSCG